MDMSDFDLKFGIFFALDQTTQICTLLGLVYNFFNVYKFAYHRTRNF